MKWLKKFMSNLNTNESVVVVDKDEVTYDKWEVAYLCKFCGIELTYDQIYHRDCTCENCGHVSSYLMDHYKTSNRSVYVGGKFSHKEWSGKHSGDIGEGSPTIIPTNLMAGMGRVPSLNTTPTIVAAGVASGLF